MYNVGDTIIYTTCGLCRIDALIQREFNGEIKNYYILKPLNDSKTSLQVQVDNPVTKEKLKTLLKKDDILNLIQKMPLVEPYWIENENERKRHFATVLRSGKRDEVLGVIKSIYEHQKLLKERGRKLHACDEQYYKDAEKMIYEEFSYVLKIEKQDIASFIFSQMEPVETCK